MNDMREEVREYKRTRIIDAASKLFFEHGYRATSVELLASELGVTKPFLYSYFKNKRAILEAVHLQAAERILEYVESGLSTAGGPAEGLEEFIRLFTLENIRNQITSGVFLQEEKNLSEETLAKVRDVEVRVNHKLAQLIQAGVDSGDFTVKDVRLAAMAISGMVRWVHRWYHKDGRYTPEEIADRFAEYGLNIVGHARR